MVEYMVEERCIWHSKVFNYFKYLKRMWTRGNVQPIKTEVMGFDRIDIFLSPIAYFIFNFLFYVYKFVWVDLSSYFFLYFLISPALKLF